MRNGHQRHFAQAAGALVGIQHLEQHFLAPGRLGLDDTTGFEADLDIVDQRALMAERLGAGDGALDAQRVRRGEYLFGRDVGIAGDAVLGGGFASEPFMAIGQAECEVGAGPV